jgi:Spy/CpxP family protein refolding chaperone
MSFRKTLFAAASLAALFLLLLPLAAQAQRQGRGQDAAEILHNPRLLARYLKLTPDQVKTLQQLAQDLQRTVQPLVEAGKPLRETLYNDLEAANPNPCTIGQDALALHENREKIKAAYEEFDRKFSAILTPEQLARYEALKEAARLLRGGDKGSDS